MPVLMGQDLTCVRGDRIVFANLNFTLSRGDILNLVGKNGSGKSSLLRLIAGLLNPISGSIKHAESLGHPLFITEKQVIKLELTVKENLKFWESVLGGPVDEALSYWGLTALAQLPAKVLSLGQRRRLQLCQLVLRPAGLWLLDEPTLGLDADGVTKLCDLVDDHCARGGIAITVSHSPLPGLTSKTLNMESFEGKSDEPYLATA